MKAPEGNYNLTHLVTNKLGLAIVQGKYNGIQPFPTEAQLAEEFDISRSVMREAVKMLTAKGLISSRPRQGIRLSPSSRWNMFDSDVLSWTLNSRPSLSLLKEFTELRFAIEPEAVTLAARIADPEAVDNIGTALLRMQAAENGKDDNLEADIEFHNNILLASQNRFLYSSATLLKLHCASLLTLPTVWRTHVLPVMKITKKCLILLKPAILSPQLWPCAACCRKHSI